MNLLCSLICMIQFLFPISDQPFTGEIIYEYQNMELMDQEKFILGKDFYLKETSGNVIRRYNLPYRALIDLNTSNIYRIYGDGQVETDAKQQSHQLDPTINTVFKQLQVTDTVDYLGYQCKVIEIDLVETNNRATHYKYYYPLSMKLAKEYEKVPGYFNNSNTLFRPFGESFMPLYVEFYEQGKEENKIIVKAVKVTQKHIKRKKYFSQVATK